MIWPLLPSDFQTVDTANVQTVHSLQLRASWSVRIVVIDRGGSKGVGGRGPNENYALCGPQIHNEACHLLQILVQRQMSKQRWWQLDNSALAPIRNVKQMSGEVQAYCPSRNYGTHCPHPKKCKPQNRHWLLMILLRNCRLRVRYEQSWLTVTLSVDVTIPVSQFISLRSWNDVPSAITPVSIEFLHSKALTVYL